MIRPLVYFVFILISTGAHAQAQRIVVNSHGWELVGDLLLAPENSEGAAVLMLNQVAGDRRPYEKLAAELADRGISSLRLDLRAHGESTNLGTFDPPTATEQDRETMLWNADQDVVSAYQFLQEQPTIDARRIAIVGASYSGEEMAEAGRDTAYAAAYVALSPGSFSDESISQMDESGASWLFVVTKNERYLGDIVAKVHERTRSVEILYLPGEHHATDILDSRPDLAARIAAWLSEVLAR